MTSPNKPDPTAPEDPKAVSAEDDRVAIEFKYSAPESGDASSEGAPAAPGSGAPPESGDAQALKVEFFDEERPPESGHLFAEPPPEPPLMPFEVIREPRPQTSTSPAGARGAKGGPSAHSAAAPVQLASSLSRPPLWVRLFWAFLPLFLLVAGFGSVVLTQKGIGYAWDEAYYYNPSLKAVDWLTDALHGGRPFDKLSIDAAWNDHPEHPSIQKFLSGIALRAFPNPILQLWAMRLPIAILFGMTLNLLYWLGRRTWGPVPGLIAALIYATMPHVFGYAHFASMETPLVFMTLLVVFCFLRGLDSPFWAVMTGLSFGLLLATKINGFFLPIPLILWGQLYARRRYVNNLFAMLVLGPIFFVLAWPWLWHDTALRILDYLKFHAAHQQTALYFMGRTWGGFGNPNAPWFYPLVMVGVTVPLTSMIVILWGLLRTLFALPRRPIGALFLLCALVMLGVACAPETPRYDGVRLFLPVFPFLALLGGSGAVGLIGLVQRLITRPGQPETVHQRRFRRWAIAGLVLILFSDGALAIRSNYPYLLSYYNPLVGGLKGADAAGFETTYWGEALNDQVIEGVNALPPGTSIKPLALHELCLQHLQDWGLIDSDIRIGGKPPYDYHLLLMRKGFFQRPERALAEPGGPFPPVKVWERKGVPMIALYKTGLEFERYWPRLLPSLPLHRPSAPSAAPPGAILR